MTGTRKIVCAWGGDESGTEPNKAFDDFCFLFDRWPLMTPTCVFFSEFSKFSVFKTIKFKILFPKINLLNSIFCKKIYDLEFLCFLRFLWLKIR